MKYSMFIGRWQPWHKGHRWLIDQRLNEGKNVLVCIREGCESWLLLFAKRGPEPFFPVGAIFVVGFTRFLRSLCAR